MNYSVFSLNKQLQSSLLNTAFRVGSLLAKFFLLIIMVRYLSPEEVGKFGLFNAGIAYVSYFVGFDFYIFLNREFIKAEKKSQKRFLKDTVFLYFINYLLVIPFIFAIFYFDYLSSSFLFYFVVILYSDHASQEFARLLVARSRQLQAGFISFVRMGLWGFLVIPFFLFFEEMRNLKTIYFFWMFSNLLSVLIALPWFSEYKFSFCRSNIDYKWIWKGIRTVFPFLIGTIALTGISTFDRFFVEEVSNSSVLGVYTFYASIANALVSLLGPSLFVYYYPNLIKNYKEKKFTIFRKDMSRLFKRVIAYMGLLAIIAAIMIDLLLQITDKRIYTNYKNIFYIMLFSTGINAIGQAGHYGLYAMHKDKAILLANLTGFFVFIFSFFVLHYLGLELYSVLIAVLLGYLAISTIKIFLYFIFESRNIHSLIDRESPL